MNNKSTAYPRGNVIVARDFGLAITTIAVAVFVALLACQIVSFREKRLEYQRSASMRYATWSFFLISISGIWMCIMCFLQWGPDWNTWNPLGCTPVALISVIFYMAVHQGAYLVLIARLKVIHDALHMNPTHIVAARWLIFLSATVGLPVMFWPFTGAFYRGFVLPEGVCVIYTTEIFTLYLFVACDFSLTAILLALFLGPVLTHAKYVEFLNPTSAKKLRRVANLNLAVSAVMSTSTLISLVFSAWGLQSVRADDLTGTTGYVQVLTTAVPVVDVLIVTFCVLVINSVWMPARLRKSLRRLKSWVLNASFSDKDVPKSNKQTPQVKDGTANTHEDRPPNVGAETLIERTPTDVDNAVVVV